MKKSPVLLILLSALIPLYGALWKSNELGQRLSLIDSAEGHEWVLSDSGSSSELFHNGVLYCRKEISPDSVTALYSDGRTEKTEYSNGHAVRTLIEDNGVVEEYRIGYDNTSMSGYLYSIDGEPKARVDFTSFNNRLLSISGDSSGYFGYGFYSFEDNGKAIIMRVGEEETDSEELEMGDDGLYHQIALIDGTKWERTYDGSLNLIAEHSDGCTLQYEYDSSNNIIRRTRTEGSTVTADEFDGGRLSLSYEYEDGDLKKERRILPDGRIEEVRHVGDLRYRFLYDIDGVRLLEAGLL